MEGESPELAAANKEAKKPPFLRVEFDGEHKIFVKECTECGSTFSTSVPKSFFENSQDASTDLKQRGNYIEGHESGVSAITTAAVEGHIKNRNCGDTARHDKKEAHQ
jgi:hypothetical protein